MCVCVCVCVHVKLTIKITKNYLPKIGEAIILVYEKDSEAKSSETPNTITIKQAANLIFIAHHLTSL